MGDTVADQPRGHRVAGQLALLERGGCLIDDPVERAVLVHADRQAAEVGLVRHRGSGPGLDPVELVV